MKCIVISCSDKVLAKKLCKKHYNRWHKYGDVTINFKPQKTMNKKYKFTKTNKNKHFDAKDWEKAWRIAKERLDEDAMRQHKKELFGDENYFFDWSLLNNER